MDIGFDEDVDTTDAVQLDLGVLVLSPVAHTRHVGATSIVLLVAYVLLVSARKKRHGVVVKCVPSARTTSLSSFAASLRPLGDSIQEL